MKTIVSRAAAGLALAAMVAVSGAHAAEQQQRLVDKARITVEELRADPNFRNLPGYLARAKAVVVMPELVKAGFIFGGEAGVGVLLARDAKSGEWSYPAFYTMAAASFGLQIGAQVSKVVLVVMTDGGLDKLMSDKLTLGADVSVAAGPVGGGVEAATTLNVDADIYSFARAKGLFGGVSFEGSVLVPSEESNTSYYGRPATPRSIVLERAVQNPGADGLRAALAAR